MNDKNYEIDELLKVKDLRKASVFVFFMSTEPRFEWVENKYFSGDRNDKSRLRNLINEVIGMASSNYNDLTNKVLNHVNNNLISIEKFEWIKEDSIASAYCWAMLNNIKPLTSASDKYTQAIQQATALKHAANIWLSDNEFSSPSVSQQIKYIKRKFGIKDNHVSTEEMYRDFQTIFDHISLEFGEKENVINMLKDEWIKSFTAVKNIKWLSKDDDDACNWIWDYICNYSVDNIKIPVWPLRFFNPESSGDKYICFYAALRAWNDNPGGKKYFLYSLKKAWQQRSFRKKQKNKKILSCSLDDEVKKHLEELAETYEMTITDLITRLIENEYRTPKK
ncbi:hypothetical protein PN925_003653 [Morganella morganii]|uniref:Uncharacterized protein n=1 Tax=Morganella morganii TaxID=582 RepID=A0A9Q4GUR0_MORMO|nr:hypothetical protein [Morganella morganii]EKW8762850.1 hypothetical protein [Morganella morganii]MCY0789493.1 hypothetical protein [Morganella morganii]